MVHNTHTKLRSLSHNRNNQHTHQIQTLGNQTGHNSLQTPRLLSLTFNHHHIYILQTPSSQTSFSTQTNTTSQKGKIHCRCKLLPEHISHTLERRNNIKAQNASDPSISELNSEITYLIQTHKSDIWREHLDTYWDYKHNTHTLWKTIHGLANTINTTQEQQNNFQI